jgi:hypothetical protein
MLDFEPGRELGIGRGEADFFVGFAARYFEGFLVEGV